MDTPIGIALWMTLATDPVIDRHLGTGPELISQNGLDHVAVNVPLALVTGPEYRETVCRHVERVVKRFNGPEITIEDCGSNLWIEGLRAKSP